VADGDGGGLNAREGASGRERADERVDGERLVVGGEEVARGTEDVCGDEQAAVGQPQRDLVPAGEADDAARFDLRRQRGADGDPVAGGERVGVAAVSAHEQRDAEDGRLREGLVEARRIERIDEEPARVEPDRGRGALEELVRMGEPREAPAVVECVRLQGAGW
jgi:hypothetical protein